MAMQVYNAGSDDVGLGTLLGMKDGAVLAREWSWGVCVARRG